jgi:hypothetical protein
MSSERKPPPAPPPHRRASFAVQPGSRNRGFGSSDPERQRETPAPAQRAAPAQAARKARGVAAGRRGRTDDDSRR